ncbi:piggyBac transposable element-derived protein 2-like [Anthonomus grandis grandis]|uniref:piggyBac transposable element-derived protein 2-like n=1 Tax=Anthonomus grandis grandis TaxID=2921223 RepID=UPI002164FA61|nr:piggyBac transposable element-derived protein 2-like [Anthonomus grandis grandis]
MASKKYYTTQELIDLVKDEQFWAAHVFITPPNDGRDSEKDSDDDEVPSMIRIKILRKSSQPGTSGHSIINDNSLELSDGNASDNSDNIPLARLITQANINRINLERSWKKVELNNSFPQFVSPKELGANVDIFLDAVACFESFFDIEICNYLVEMLNLYARQKGNHNFSTDAGELKCFDTEQDNKFAKLQPLFNMLNERFLSYAPLNEKLSIDESMVLYFGRHEAKQYIKAKQAVRRYMDPGLGGSVVMTLLGNLPKNVPFKICGDRYFSSLKLVNSLQKIEVGYTSTINGNRLENCPLPNKMQEKKGTRGSFDYSTDANSQITVTL